MKNTKKLPALLLIPLAIVSSAHAALVVVPNDTGADLANSILGPGISLVSGSVSYSGATTGASGTFTGGLSAGIGIESGLILTTGLASNAVGPNTTGSITGPGTTSTLSFSFSTLGGDLFFNYVFASEEYNEFVNSAFNDKFKFNLDGVNIALLPGTSIPVEIDTVNLGANPSLYNNNDTGTFNIQYDGFTDVLTAKALGLSPGTHTIVLTIFDVGDSALDSAVFIQGNSFSDTPTPPTGSNVPDGGATLALLSTALLGLAGIKRKLR
jgi:VPDSG-CTERM motif